MDCTLRPNLPSDHRDLEGLPDWENGHDPRRQARQRMNARAVQLYQDAARHPPHSNDAPVFVPFLIILKDDIIHNATRTVGKIELRLNVQRDHDLVSRPPIIMLTLCTELISSVPSSNPTFVERNFTEAEIAYCRAQPSPASSFAARWDGKEAVFKALGVASKAPSRP